MTEKNHVIPDTVNLIDLDIDDALLEAGITGESDTSGDSEKDDDIAVENEPDESDESEELIEANESNETDDESDDDYEDGSEEFEEESKDDSDEEFEDESDEDDSVKVPFVKRLFSGLPNLLIYTAVYAVFIILWELLLRHSISGKVEASNMCFLFFVPAQALMMASLTGFSDKYKWINKLLIFIGIFAIAAYYIVQVVYLRNFGSLFSVSMVGMGTNALGNFWWALKDALLASTWKIVFILLPVLLVLIVSIFSKKVCGGYHILLHVISAGLAVVLWLLAIQGLKLCGTDRQSAYATFYNTLADTDTTSSKLGAFTTTLIEGGSYFLGIKTGNSNESLVAVEVSAHDMNNFFEMESVSGNGSVSDNDPESVSVDYVIEPQIFEQIDFTTLSSMAPDQDTVALCDYFASKEPTYTNEMTGYFEGYNLIYICAESFSTLALDEEVTPTLYKMAHGGIVLDNFYNSFKNTTTNGEYAFMTSLWPDVSRDASQGTAVGSFARSVSKYMPMGMGDLFEANGVHTYAFHNYYGHYYRRSYSWPNLGYRDMKFLGAGMQFTSYWPASDLELMEQSIDDYINEDQFHVYYMTFSGHGPYTGSNYIHNKNIDHVTEVLGSRADTMTPEAIGYLSNNYELELAMNHLLGRLAAAGKLSNTVIVITGDHTPYYLPDEGKNSIVGSEIDTDFGIYHSTCIIYNSAMETIETDTYCCNVDIAPTMLNLFNIPYDSRLMMGTDIFSDGVHRARLYNGSFLTDKLRYNSETGQVDWFIDTSSYSDEICNSYLNTMINYTEGEYAAATKMLDNNFMLYVWKNSGLMSEDEYWAELQREEFEEQRAATELLEEEEEAALEAAMAAEAAAAEEGNTEPPAQAPVQENVPAPEVPAVPEEQAVPQPEQ